MVKVTLPRPSGAARSAESAPADPARRAPLGTAGNRARNARTLERSAPGHEAGGRPPGQGRRLRRDRRDASRRSEPRPRQADRSRPTLHGLTHRSPQRPSPSSDRITPKPGMWIRPGQAQADRPRGGRLVPGRKARRPSPRRPRRASSDPAPSRSGKSRPAQERPRPIIAASKALASTTRQDASLVDDPERRGLAHPAFDHGNRRETISRSTLDLPARYLRIAAPVRQDAGPARGAMSFFSCWNTAFLWLNSRKAPSRP